MIILIILIQPEKSFKFTYHIIVTAFIDYGLQRTKTAVLTIIMAILDVEEEKKKKILTHLYYIYTSVDGQQWKYIQTTTLPLQIKPRKFTLLLKKTNQVNN